MAHFHFNGSSKQALYQPYKRMDKMLNNKDMVRRAIEERQIRESYLKRIKSSIVIQSYYRAHVATCKLREELKKEIDIEINKSFESIPKLFCLLTKFFFAYQLERKFSNANDYNSILLFISSQMLKNAEEIGEEVVKNMTNDKISMIYMVSSIKKVLTLCIRFIRHNASQQDVSLDVPLQIIKCFTCLNTYLRDQNSNEVEDHSFDIVTNIVDYLFNDEYYLALKSLIENRLQIATVESQNGFLNDILLFDNLSYLQRNTRSSFYQRIIFKLFVQPLKHESKKYLLMNLNNLSFPYIEMLEYLSVMGLKQLTSVQVQNLFHCLLSLAEPHYSNMRFNDICIYFKIIADIMNCLSEKIDSNEEEDLECGEMSCVLKNEINENRDDLIVMCFDLFGNNHDLSNSLKKYLDLFGCVMSSKIISHLCQICYNLTTQSQKNLNNYSFFNVLGSSSIFIRKLWEILNKPRDDEFNSFSSKISLKTDLPLFSTFCNTFKHRLETLTKDYLFENINMESCIKPFDGLLDISSSALTIVDCCLQMNFVICSNYHDNTELKRVFEEATHLVRCLYDLDNKIKFMNDKLWAVHSLPLLVICPNGLKYRYAKKDKRYDVLRDGLTNISEALPFVFTFESRFEFFRNNAKNKLNECDQIWGVIRLRRNHIYEDAFQKIQKDKEFDLKKKYAIKFLNVFGHEEFFNLYYGPMKETLHGVVTTGFNPNFGLFKETSERCLYPDPSSEFSRKDYLEHYYFLGMILGKAIMENLNYNLPFASFFLIKMLSKDLDELNFHHMSSLDPVLYKNLLYLRDTDDVESLELYFNLEYDVQGSLKSVDLKPNGSIILVDNSNKHEYINLFAAWHLNERIRKHCIAFKNGLQSIISIDKLRIFNHEELQFLISGANVPIDVEDLKKHTVYEYDCDSIYPEVIKNFWSVVGEMTETQKEDLLTFVTSHRRCPPFGFKTLDPSFNIEIWEDISNNFSTTHLPKSATCHNKIFLPAYESREILKENLLKAITPGFEESILNHNLQ